MKPHRLLLVSVLLGALLAAAEDDDQQLYLEGKKAFRSCAACHCVTDPTLQEDEDWLDLNQVTNCIDAGELTPRVREALDVFFRSQETLRPLLIDENHQPAADARVGQLRVPATSGSAFLKADRESVRDGSPAKIRLFWRASAEGQTLSVPAGTYRIINYRFYRRPEAGGEKLWTLSATNVNGCGELRVSPDEPEDFYLEPLVCAEVSTEEAEDGVKISLAVRDEWDNTLTLSVAGAMWLPSLAIADAEGESVYEAAFDNT